MAAGLVDIGGRFAEFAKFGDSKSDGKLINLKNSDKWMKQANLFTKDFTTTDTAISFAKFKSKTMDHKTYLEYCADLCKTKNMDPAQFLTKLVASGAPGTTNTTESAKMDVTSRLTDTSKYTGAHKERFDSAGKGKGAAGRDDIAANDGYVQGSKINKK